MAETGFGQVDIAVVDGVAAWLELKTGFGRVHNDLEAADSPATGEEAVEIRARTGYGDITIRRSTGTQKRGRGHDDHRDEHSACPEDHGPPKSFDDKVVLDKIDLEIAEGTVFALLGPNGAGKTTAVQILSTFLPKDGGDVEVAGFDLEHDPDRVRATIGVTGRFSAVDNLLTGEENLLLMADLRRLDRQTGRRRARELVERFDLADAARKTVATYSGGMRRRLDLAMSGPRRARLAHGL